MHKMFKLNFKNVSSNISIQNHISKDENHVWHPQSYYKQQTFDLFLCEKKYNKKKIGF